MPTSTESHDLNLANLPPLGDGLLAELNQLRNHDPLYWSEVSRCWIVSGHKEVTEGFSGNLPLSNNHIPKSLYRVMPPEELQSRLPNAMRYMPSIVTNLDGDEHSRVRKLLLKALNRKMVERLRPFVQARVTELLDIAEQRGELEFHEEISRMLPGAVILKMLGMDQSYLPRLKGWADGVAAALTTFDPTPEGLDGLELVVTDMVEVFTREIDDRRQNPSDDLISLLLHATEEGDSFSMDEMLATLLLLIIAGHDTTSNSLSLGIRALAAHPDAWDYWRQHSDRQTDNIVELMRYIAMSTTIPRIAISDFEWGGRQIHEGDLVMLMIAAGNRDTAVYDQAEVLDFSRKNDLSLTFGPGLHHCLGHMLAKLQMGEFFNALVERFEKIEVTKPPEFTGVLVFRGVTGLQTRFYPRKN
jgi:cytochrome P450